MNPSSTPLSAQEKVVLITGAAKRLGREIALQFARQGWSVGVHYGNSQAEAIETVAIIEDLGGRACAFQANLAIEAEVHNLFKVVEDKLGVLDCLVNSASIFEYDRASAEDEILSAEFLQRHLAVNLVAPVLLSQLMFRQQKQRGKKKSNGGDIVPSIIHLLDQKLINLNPDYFSYTVSKGALLCATELLAMDFAPHLRVVGLAPGITLPSGDQSEEDFLNAHQMTPMKRSSTPTEIAKAAVFLAESSAITGTTLYVDGGQHLLPSTRDVMFNNH